jgi:hypothetical protein
MFLQGVPLILAQKKTILLMIQCGSGRIICMGFQYFLESTTQSSTNNPLDDVAKAGPSAG